MNRHPIPRPPSPPRRTRGASSRAGVPGFAPALLYLVLLCLTLLRPAGSAMAQSNGTAAADPRAGLERRLEPLIAHGGVAVGENGHTLFRFRPGAYVPASILKLATSLAAFHHLGPGYRFATEFYRRGDTLYVKGLGDPFLVSEEWAAIMVELRTAGALSPPPTQLVLDTTAFTGPLEVDGLAGSLNPYDARLGALVSNFNTVFVAVAPGGAVSSAEPQTPLTPLAAKLGHTLPPGEHRINLTARGVPGWRYTADLARTFLAGVGVILAAEPALGTVPEGLQPVLVHRNARTLAEMVAGLMEFSNNYIANQLVLGMALAVHGRPARFADGMTLLREFLHGNLGLDARDFHLVEGSGISRKNRMNLSAMLKITDAFHPWAHLMAPYGRNPMRLPAKTGSLKGVYSLAGFLPAPEGSRRPFVIMLNQPRRTRYEVLKALWRAFPAPGS